MYVSIIWQALFQKDTGILNHYLTALGGDRIDWLNELASARSCRSSSSTPGGTSG